MAKGSRRPIQREGMYTREANLVTLGMAGAIVVSFLPFASYVFVPLLVVGVLWAVAMAARLYWLSTTVDDRVAFGPLTPGQLEEQAASIDAAIRAGHLRDGDVVADGIIITQERVNQVRAAALAARVRAQEERDSGAV